MSKDRKDFVGLISQKTELKVTDLINKVTLQAMQDQFNDEYSDYNFGNGLLDANAEPIMFERGHCAYCKGVRETEEGYSMCRRSDNILIKAIKKSGKACWRVCEGQLLDFGAPITIEGRIVAFFCWGQIRCEYCKTRSNGILGALRQLDFRKARDGRRATVPTRLQKKYYQIKNRNKTEIQEIAKIGLDFTKRLNVILGKLAKWEKPREIDEFVAKMVRKHDLDSLFVLCVKEIPRILGTRDCSIFTVIRESIKVEPRLVLQKTSYKKSKHREGRASYAKGEGLTGWVWENGCALRLADIKDKKELERYRYLEWSKGEIVNDSNFHKEWLGVPLFGNYRNIIGVIRVPAKKKGGGHHGGGFDFQDEIYLMMLGQAVAREIEVLRQRERVLLALKVSQECALKFCCAENQIAVAKMVVDASAIIFGEDEKAHFFNMFHRDEGKLRVMVLRGDLTADWMKGREVPKNSLSASCLKVKKAKIVHNIPKALDENSYFELAEEVECAMSVPIWLGNQPFGCLSVGSSRKYEFAEEPDLHILQDIASIAAATFARLNAEELAQQNLVETVRGVTHTLGNRIPTLNNWLTLLQQKANGQFAEEINTLIEGLDFLIGAVDVAKQFGKMSEPIHIQSFELGPIFQRLERLYSDKHISWKIQGQLPMLGDSTLIEQVIIELIVNSQRFINNKTGEIEVSAYRRKIKLSTGTPRSTVIIRVNNNGPAIPANQKSIIFKPAMTADPATHFGLGLSFVQNVAQRHGGYAEECGNVKKGVSFRAIFPQ